MNLPERALLGYIHALEAKGHRPLEQDIPGGTRYVKNKYVPRIKAFFAEI
jgi:hypothetical protein